MNDNPLASFAVTAEPPIELLHSADEPLLTELDGRLACRCFLIGRSIATPISQCVRIWHDGSETHLLRKSCRSSNCDIGPWMTESQRQIQESEWQSIYNLLLQSCFWDDELAVHQWEGFGGPPRQLIEWQVGSNYRCVCNNSLPQSIQRVFNQCMLTAKPI